MADGVACVGCSLCVRLPDPALSLSPSLLPSPREKDMGCHCILDVEGARTTIVDPKVSNQSPLDGHIGALRVCVCVCVCARVCLCCVCLLWLFTVSLLPPLPTLQSRGVKKSFTYDYSYWSADPSHKHFAPQEKVGVGCQSLYAHTYRTVFSRSEDLSLGWSLYTALTVCHSELGRGGEAYMMVIILSVFALVCACKVQEFAKWSLQTAFDSRLNFERWIPFWQLVNTIQAS